MSTLEQLLPVLRAQLQRRQVELVAEMQAQRGGAAISHNHNSAGEADKAANEVANTMEIAHFERDQTELTLVETALAMMEGDRYGYCEDCGDAISLPRLQATPHVTRCIQCQEQFEKDLQAHGLAPHERA